MERIVLQLDAKTEQVELKKNEFQNLGMSRLIAISGTSGPSEFQRT